MKKTILLLLTAAALPQLSYGQCACIGGAAVGGLTPAGGTINVGVLREGFARASLYYRYSTGNTWMRGDSRAETGPVVGYRTHYTGLLFGYGISNRFTIESEIGYFPRKIQDFDYTVAAGSGLSHVLISGKYNAWHSIVNELEATLGAGARIPLVIKESNLPQHVMPSSGAYGLMLQAFLHKGWKIDGIRLFLIHRSDFSAENRLDYHYGSAHVTSLAATKTLFKATTAIVELRHENRRRDRLQGVILDDTGGNTLFVAPQLNVVLGSINLSAIFDYPLYGYYNGHQLANDYSFAFNITWQPHIAED